MDSHSSTVPCTEYSGVHFPAATVNCEGEQVGRAACADAEVAPDDSMKIDNIATTAVSVDTDFFVGLSFPTEYCLHLLIVATCIELTAGPDSSLSGRATVLDSCAVTRLGANSVTQPLQTPSLRFR
jgi:hypothetical protein